MTREEKVQVGKYVLQMANFLADGCYQQEMLLKAAHIIDEALEQESSGDVISRQAVIDAIDKWVKNMHILITLLTNEVTPLFESVLELPSVTPKQKTGRWIPRNAFLLKYKCSECGRESEKYNFCPNCGARMEEDEISK